MAMACHESAEAKVVVDVFVSVDVVNLAAFSVLHKNWIRLVVAVVAGDAERNAFECALMSGRRFGRSLFVKSDFLVECFVHTKLHCMQVCSLRSVCLRSL